MGRRSLSRKSRKSQRPFGHRKKSKKLIGRAKAIAVQAELSKLLRCSICDNFLPNAPKGILSKELVDTFSNEYKQLYPCIPMHCNVCLCDQCTGQDTLSDIENSLKHCCKHETCPTECQTDFYCESIDSDSCADHSTNECFDNDPEFVPGSDETATESDTSFDDIPSDLDDDNNNVNQNEFRIINLGQLSGMIATITVHAALCKTANAQAKNGESSLKLCGIAHYGLASIMTVKCDCGTEFSLPSSPKISTKNSTHFEINIRAVWAQMATGGGQFRLDEQMTTMGMPGMSEKTFVQIENEIGSWWKETLQKEMIEAGIMERKLAEERGDYDEMVPFISVIIDCGWSKSAHKHTYNAKAGVGVIIGRETKRVLYMEVKQKSCAICERAESLGIPPKKHDCSANWSESSQAMEAAIFLEGFREAESTHGVRYLRVIGDGDSSVLPTLQAEGPEWCKRIVKDECANHSVKCLRSNLEKLVEDYPQFKGKGMLTKRRRVQITTAARCAIKMRSKQVESLGKRKAAGKLAKDLNNIGRHVLGTHDFCSSDFCKHAAKPASSDDDGVHDKNEDDIDDDDDDDEDDDDDDTDILSAQAQMWADATSDKDLEASRSFGTSKGPIDAALLTQINRLLNRMAEKANRLINNETSNLAENWMSIRCKLDGGKKVFRSHRFSWYYRCFGAGIRRNQGPCWGAITWETCTNTPASQPMWKHGQQQQDHIERVKKVNQNPKVQQWKKKRKYHSQTQATSKKAKAAYGPDADVQVVPDISESQLKQVCDTYFEKEVNVSEKQANLIERMTTLQSSSGLWIEERRKRLTASGFGEVTKRNPKLKIEPYVRNKLYKTFRGNQYTNHGIQQEHASILDYEAKMSKETGKNVKVKSAGFKICKEFKGLGATTDGIVTIDGVPSGLLEIKNVLKNKTTTFEEYAKSIAKSKSKSKFCLQLVDGELALNRKDNYYYQIQGQLNIYDYSWCDFLVRSTNPYQLHIERINKDTKLWNEEMLPKLQAMYTRVLLPELASPRHGKKPGIREPKEGNWFPEGAAKAGTTRKTRIARKPKRN